MDSKAESPLTRQVPNMRALAITALTHECGVPSLRTATALVWNFDRGWDCGAAVQLDSAADLAVIWTSWDEDGQFPKWCELYDHLRYRTQSIQSIRFLSYGRIALRMPIVDGLELKEALRTIRGMGRV